MNVKWIGGMTEGFQKPETNANPATRKPSAIGGRLARFRRDAMCYPTTQTAGKDGTLQE